MEFRQFNILDTESFNFWTYMYVILVGQALVFLFGGCWGGGGGGVEGRTGSGC